MNNSLLARGMNTSYLYVYSPKPSPNHRLPLQLWLYWRAVSLVYLCFLRFSFIYLSRAPRGRPGKGLAGFPPSGESREYKRLTNRYDVFIFGVGFLTGEVHG